MRDIADAVTNVTEESRWSQVARLQRARTRSGLGGSLVGKFEPACGPMNLGRWTAEAAVPPGSICPTFLVSLVVRFD